jgi:hypothetical protein
MMTEQAAPAFAISSATSQPALTWWKSRGLFLRTNAGGQQDRQG